jgi:cofilin
MTSKNETSEVCVQEFEKLRTHSIHDYIVFKFDASLGSLVIDKFGPPGASFEQFLADLPPNEPCYAVKRMVFTSKDGSTRRPIIFVLWCPDQAPTKLKMIAAGTKHTFRQLLTGISYEIAATDLSELSLDHLIEKFRVLYGES